MKNKQLAILLVAVVAAAILLVPRAAAVVSTIKPESQAVGSIIALVEVERITHAQETWMRALEWCESHGVPEAVNPMDRDGTPSYGAWQFKPSTLDYYAELYDVATTSVKDRDVQEAVLTQMILHRDEINWRQQFPDCVNRFVGLPPSK